MKATVLKSVVLLALVFAGALNAEMSAKNGYFTNDEMQGNLVISKTIYVNDGYLQNHLKYNYTYDEYSRMTSKEALKWNKDSGSWLPYYQLSFSYSENEMIVELGCWNSKDKAYNLLKEKNVYEIDDLNIPVAYLSYKWDTKNNNWEEIDNISYIKTDDLLAIGE